MVKKITIQKKIGIPIIAGESAIVGASGVVFSETGNPLFLVVPVAAGVMAGLIMRDIKKQKKLKKVI